MSLTPHWAVWRARAYLGGDCGEASSSADKPPPPTPLNLRLLPKRSVGSSCSVGLWRLFCLSSSVAPSSPPCASCRAQHSSYVITALWSLSTTFFSPDATPAAPSTLAPTPPIPPGGPGTLFPQHGSPDGTRSSGKRCSLRSALILSGLNVWVDCGCAPERRYVRRACASGCAPGPAERSDHER